MAALTEYTVISETDLETFIKKVQALPVNPWRPAGSIATSVVKITRNAGNFNIEEDVVVYTQAFVKE